jgi:F-type H+-transporting ATPase subunit gamma
VRIIVTRFLNTLVQQPLSMEYLPVGEISAARMPEAEFDDALGAEASDVMFEPNAEALLAYLLGHYLNIYMYYVLLNAKASEQSARMVSMKNATYSAERLIETLTLEYNKLRQDNITRELLEIAGGQAG